MAKRPFNKSNLFAQERKQARIIASSTEHGKLLWHSLLGTLMGAENRIATMRTFLSPADVPSDMPFEREVFRALHHCNERNIPPTFENILAAILVTGEIDAPQADIKDQLEKIAEKRSDANMALESYSHWVAQNVMAQRNTTAWNVALSIINGKKGDAHERQEAALNIITSSTQADQAFESGTDADLTDEFFDWADGRYQEYLAGNTHSGPLLPWYGFIGEHGILPGGMDWGDMTLITAQSGFGKSTLVGQIAEYNGYTAQTCDVLVILLETNLMKMKARSLARNCLIPFDMVKVKRFNHKDPRFHKDIHGQDYRKTKATPAKGSLGWYQQWVNGSDCGVNYAFAPGASAYEITQLMSLYRRKAEAREKGLLVIVDYLQKIDWTMFSYDQRVGLERVADVIRDGIEIQNNKSPLHMIMMAQENEMGDPYGGRGILQRAQLHISLSRSRRQPGAMLDGGDLPIKNSDGSQRTDAIGNSRWYQRATDMLAAQSSLVVRKSNDAPGREIKVVFENAKYRIHHSQEEAQQHAKLAEQLRR